MPAITSISQSAVIAVLAAVFAGCAGPSANLIAHRPATINSAGMRRIAVVDQHAEEGAAVAQLLAVELRNTGQFELVSQTDLQRAAREPLRDQQGRLKPHVAGDAARRLGLDGLLVGNAQRVDSLSESGFTIASPTAGAALHYELVDARSGQIREADTLRYEVLANRTDSEMQTALAVCARRLARSMAPHNITIEIPLAYGEWLGGPVGRGNIWAAQGDWERAAHSWREAVDADPGDHAALYNLGVAAEVAENFPEAESFYLRASRLRNEPMYAQAIQRAARRREQTMHARQQYIARAGYGAAPMQPPPMNPPPLPPPSAAGPIQHAGYQPAR